MIANRIGRQFALGDQLCAGVVQCDPGAGDRGATRAAVSLQDIAVEGDLALAESVQVDHGAQGASDQALDFLRAAALFAFCGFARATGVRRTRQHAVFGSYPALALATLD